MRAFTAKGRFADLLAGIPVRVILNDRTALMGAALAAEALADPAARLASSRDRDPGRARRGARVRGHDALLRAREPHDRRARHARLGDARRPRARPSWPCSPGAATAPHGSQFGWLAVSGVGNVAGLALVYAAVRRGKVGVVAPITSTEGAVAAVIAIALGEEISAGVGFCARPRRRRRRPVSGGSRGRGTDVAGRRRPRLRRRGRLRRGHLRDRPREPGAVDRLGHAPRPRRRRRPRHAAAARGAPAAAAREGDEVRRDHGAGGGRRVRVVRRRRQARHRDRRGPGLAVRRPGGGGRVSASGASG